MLIALELEIFSDGRKILRGIRLCAITVGSQARTASD